MGKLSDKIKDEEDYELYEEVKVTIGTPTAEDSDSGVSYIRTEE